MRPPRIAILVLFFAASIFLFCRSVSSLRRSGPAVTPASPQKSQLRSFFSFTGAFTLFPPNAAISLTDDNSTFFPARPAAFGPPLPAKGLSGQLWIGSGFTDDNLQDGETEGELGCSDVPGWEDGKAGLALKTSEKAMPNAEPATADGKAKHTKRTAHSRNPVVDRAAASRARLQTHPDSPPLDDGTDDYLHQGFQQAKRIHLETSPGSESSHADIQSIQEAAEITGKVVLLSRGGCGFLEKVKWAQRRGAIAVIVGDNQKGGPLIQMFARGNVDNVSIPSIFTSRTTAHLLSSLVQPGSFIEDILDENGNPILKVQQSGKARKGKKTKQLPTTTAAVPKSTAKPKSAKAAKSETDSSPRKEKSHTPKSSHQGGWFSRLFHWGSGSGSGSNQSRRPSSGRLDWIMLDDWSDEKDQVIRTSLDKAASRSQEEDTSISSRERSSGDDFQIGVEDWRDPDLVGSPSTQGGHGSPAANDMDSPADGQSRTGESGTSAKHAGKKTAHGSSKDTNGSEGGINTPGSGEYVPEMTSDGSRSGTGRPEGSSGSQGGLISKIFGEDDEDDFTHDTEFRPPSTESPDQPPNGDDGDDLYHEGLWVTITPSSSASPFFDTLLVLVISPLITLTVVYALLILRAKIRRRRWRAPKSVVDRLPVRTYHTVAPSPIPSPRQPSPISSSPTTPLLQGSSRTRPRPRSRTTTGVPEPADSLLRVDSALELPRSLSRAEHEKPNISSEWKKYMGRQVECVVCLEEYIDGVSRVMSLPCGHEFHAECM